MTTDEPAPDSLDAAIAEYLRRVDAGETPDLEAFLAAHPSHADGLRSFFRDRERIAPFVPMLSVDADATIPPRTDAGGSPTVIRYFGDYELLDEIARGGMGVVYRARQVSLNRTVALKMILAGNLANAADVARFRAEAEAAANLDHPNILPIYEVGEHEGQHYFSMKLIEGGNLAAALKKRFTTEDTERNTRSSSVFSVSSVVKLLSTIARAVHYAHQRGILHRDLKPANILLDAEGTPYVTDFGLAKRVESDSGLTQSGAIVGTPSYMAPEQARAEKQLSTAVDVYSLGAILYECLTGRPPFRAATTLDTILQVLEQEPERPANCDRDLATIALKCLEKQSAKRYDSAAALADELERWTRSEPILARPAGRIERVTKWVRRNPLPSALAISLILGITGTTVFALRSREQASQAELQLARADWLVYAGQIEAALRALNAGDWNSARQQLGECRWDFRGWEHDYLTTRLRRRTRGEVEDPKPPQRPYPRTEFRMSQDGRRRVSWDSDQNEVYDAIGGKVRTVKFERTRWDTSSAAIDPNHGLIAFPWPGISVVEISTRQKVLAITEFGSFAFSPAGDRFVVIEEESSKLRVWDTATWRETLTIPDFSKAISRALKFSPDGRWLGCCWWPMEQAGAFADLETGKVTKFAPPAEFLTLGPKSQSFVIHRGLWHLSVIETATSDKKMTLASRSLDEHNGGLRPTYSPDGTRLAVLTGPEIEIWSLATGQRVLSIPAPRRVDRVEFRSDGKALLPVKFRAWAPSQGWGIDSVFDLQPWDGSEPLDLRLLQPYKTPGRVGFSADGRRAIGQNESGKTLVVWNLFTGQIIPDALDQLPDSPSQTSPDGRFRLDPNDAGGIRLIGLKRGNEQDDAGQ